jgi:hypothetical protein
MLTRSLTYSQIQHITHSFLSVFSLVNVKTKRLPFALLAFTLTGNKVAPMRSTLRTPSSITALTACARTPGRFAAATANDVFIYACEAPANGDAVRLVRLAAIANAIVQPVVQLALCTPLLAYSSGDDFFLLRLELRRDVPPISAEEAAAAAAAALRRDALDVVDTPLSQIVCV